MPNRKWTKAQQTAIEDEGGSLLVSAAAGSGKTAVLVERAVRLMTREDAPVPADRLLIVTFTAAAAEELRSRLGARIEQELRKTSGNVFLRRQRILLRRAAIGTMDAFCQQLVKEHFAQLDVPPDISVGDEALLASLSAAALDDTMEEMYEDEDFARLAALYGRTRSDAAAATAILNLYDFCRTLPFPQKQAQCFADMYANANDAEQSPWAQELLQYARQGSQAMVLLLRQAVSLVQEEEALQPYLPALLQDVDQAGWLYAACSNGNWDDCVEALQNCIFGRLGTVRGYEGDIKEQVKGLRATAKDIAAQLQKYCLACTMQEFVQDIKEAGPLVQALCRAVNLYSQKYEEAKINEKVLDFADFEHLALSLLCNEQGERTAVARQVSARFDAVMVDEFQDTNELQSALYEALANEEGSNLFYVGDVKQSIYRFRKANPGIFLDKKASWHPVQSGQHPAVITLGHNFRSSLGVVGAVNYCFDALMSGELGEIEYNEEEKLLQGAPGGDETGLELHILQDEDGVGDAAALADRILQMVHSGYQVREGDFTRPCGYGDFCVLLRARARMPEYVAALQEKGIPVAADNSESLLETPEVLPVVAALRAIDNPGDEVPLAAALVGPLFHFTPDEATGLRVNNKNTTLYAALLGSKLPKAQNFLSQLSYYRALAGQAPVGRVCEELLDRTGYLSAVAAMEGGAARRQNLLRFISWAAETAASGRGSLASFVRVLQHARGPASTSATAIPGHVSIMTIHRSKGLEFPVCILADTARKFNTSDLNARVQLHTALGVGIALRSGNSLFATAPALAIRRRTERESISEEMRVLYVALTRAKDRLLLFCAVPNAAKFISAQAAELVDGRPEAFLLSHQRSFAQWMVSALLSHPNAEELRKAALAATLPIYPAEGSMQFFIEEAQSIPQVQTQEFALTAEPQPQEVEQLLQLFHTSMPRLALAKVPVKVTVSALAKPHEESLRKRPAFMYQSGLTAAERGTVQHAFLQFADYGRAAAGLEAEITTLVQHGHLEQLQADTLDRNGIAAFLNSSLMQRIQKGQLLREYAFITSLPASEILAELPAEYTGEPVLVQGIADAVLVFEDSVEIVDYKTDRRKTAQDLIERYGLQLRIYARAVAKRLGKPVTRLTIWSFDLSQAIDVPM